MGNVKEQLQRYTSLSQHRTLAFLLRRACLLLVGWCLCFPLLTWAQDAQEAVRTMITASMENGGTRNEGAILQAKQHLETLKAQNPPLRGYRKKAREYNDKGIVFIQAGQFPEAVHAFREAYQADAGDIEIINNLGDASMRDGDLETAEQMLVRALALAPGRSNAWANLGQTYAKQKKPAEAIACFANAYRFSRNQEATRRFLQGLTEKEDEDVRAAAQLTLQLSLLGTAGQPAISPRTTEEQQVMSQKDVDGQQASQTLEAGGPLNLTFGNIPFGQARSQVLAKLEGAEIKQDASAEFELGEYDFIAEDLKEGLYYLPGIFAAVGASLYSRVTTKYDVSYKGWPDVQGVSLYFYGDDERADVALFLVVKKLRLRDRTAAADVFAGARAAISRTLAIEPITTQTRYRHVGYEKESYPAMAAKWSTGAVTVYYAVNDFGLYPGDPMLAYIDKEGWKRYVNKANAAREAQKQKNRNQEDKTMEDNF